VAEKSSPHAQNGTKLYHVAGVTLDSLCPVGAPVNDGLPVDWPVLARVAFRIVAGLTWRLKALINYRSFQSPLGGFRIIAERDELRDRCDQETLRGDILLRRLEQMTPAKRPHFKPEDRFRILMYKDAVGLNAEQTAAAFGICVGTLHLWERRYTEDGKAALVASCIPVNRYDDYLAGTVQLLKLYAPQFGVKRIVHLLAMCGLLLCPSTIRRMLLRKLWPLQPNDPEKPPPDTGATEAKDGASPAGAETEAAADPAPRQIRARCPHAIWHVDLTPLPLCAMRTVYEPGKVPPSQPYAFWLGAVLDNYTRAIVGFEVFEQRPTGEEVCEMLDVAVGVAGRAPRHIISDQGCEFQEAFLEWCDTWGVKHRYGAVHQHGSIVMIERFWRSLKEEMWRRLPILMPSRDWIREEVRLYLHWYHEHRPHQGIGGRTPAEVRDGRTPAREQQPIEPRARYPLERPGPWETARRVGRLELGVDYVEGRAHLPIVSLRPAA